MSTGPTSAETTALLLESPRLLSVAEYHRMIEAGILGEDERVELLEGVIVSMTPQGPPHAYCIQWLNRLLVRSLGDDYAVRPQSPLTLGQWNEPEPDLTVVRADESSRDHHPGTAVLAIEVADTSLRKDRKVKASVYARFGVTEYWIVNVEARVVEIFEDPDRSAETYRRTRTCSIADTLTSTALPQLSFRVADLFG
jgi:Uma2 family endonuclease